MTEVPKRKRQSAGPYIYKQRKIVESVQFRGNLSYGDHEQWSSVSWEKGTKPNSSITALDLRRTKTVQGSAWKNLTGDCPGEKKGPGELVDFSGLPSPKTWMVHTSVHKIKQRWQETCKKLLTELKYKKEAYKQDPDGSRRNRDPAWACSNGFRIASTYLDFCLGKDRPLWTSLCSMG